MKLRFYDIDSEFTDYLRGFDSKIPYIGYENRDKFLCGIVLSINNCNYYVPVSSNKNKFLSSFIIYDVKRKGDMIPISSLRFSFMFPCPIECISERVLKNETDEKYKNLTQKEYEFCNKHVEAIRKKALTIYNLAKNDRLRTKYNLCDFSILEEKCKEYIQKLHNERSEINLNDEENDEPDICD